MSNGKAMIISLIVGLLKKVLVYKIGLFSGTRIKNKIKVEVVLSIYAISC